MPVKQRIAKTTRPRLTPEIFALWMVLREIQDDREGVRWEEDGGRHREYLDGTKRLAILLGLDWGDMIGPLDVTSPHPPDYIAMHQPHRAETWREAFRWRVALMQAEAEA